MSARALLKAVETRLRSAAVLNDPTGTRCGIQTDGRPPGQSGQLYYAIHWAGARDRQEATTADQVDLEHQVTVTISARLGVAPPDRRGAKISTTGDLLDLAEALAQPGVIHGQYAHVMNAANALIPGTQEYSDAQGGTPPPDVTTNGFEEPLHLIGLGPVLPKNKDWMTTHLNPDVYAVEVRFGKARRLQI